MSTNGDASAARPPTDVEASSAQLRGTAVRGGAVFLAARLGTQLFTWSTTIFVARLLSRDDYALLAIGGMLIGLSDLMGEAGIGAALVQKKEVEPADVAESFTIAALLAGILYLALVAVSGAAADYWRLSQLSLLLPVMGVMVLMTPFRSIAFALLERDLGLVQKSVAHVLSHLLQASLVLGLALAGVGYWALAIGSLVGRAVETLALMYCAGWLPRLTVPGLRGRALLFFGINVSAASLLTFAYHNADVAVVGRLVGPDVGYYALAVQLMSLPVHKLTATLNMIAYPVFCRLQHDRERAALWYLRSTTMLCAVGAPALIGLALVAPDAIALILGEKWLPAVWPFRALTLAGVMMVLAESLPTLLNAMGRPDLTFRNKLLSAVLLPVAFIVGGLLGGMHGVCYAWLIAYPLIVLAQFHFTSPITGVGLVQLARTQGPIFLSVAAMCATVLAAQHALGDLSRPVRLGLTVLVGAGTHAVMLLCFARESIVADLFVLWGELRRRPRPGTAPPPSGDAQPPSDTVVDVSDGAEGGLSRQPMPAAAWEGARE